MIWNIDGSFEMSVDHKPTSEGEINRVQKAGGFIVENRINGSLSLTRALGDFDYKK